MKKFLQLVLVLFIFNFFGCINYEQETFLGIDGSGSAIIHYWTDREIIYQDSSKENKFSFIESVIKKNFQHPSVKVRKLRIWKEKKDTTFHAEIHIIFDDINKLVETEFYKDEKIEFVDGALGQKVFKQNLKGIGTQAKEFKKYFIKYIYHFPGTIISDNAKEKTNNTLIWSFQYTELTNDKMLTATVKIPESKLPNKLIITILIGLLIVLWIIIIIRLKKRTSEVE